MRIATRVGVVLGFGITIVAAAALSGAEEDQSAPKAYIDGTGPGWKELGEADVVPVNGAADTWSWKDGIIHCSGQPVGVARTAKPYGNFELVAQWRHLKSAGNSGIFVWAPEEARKDLK